MEAIVHTERVIPVGVHPRHIHLFRLGMGIMDMDMRLLVRLEVDMGVEVLGGRMVLVGRAVVLLEVQEGAVASSRTSIRIRRRLEGMLDCRVNIRVGVDLRVEEVRGVGGGEGLERRLGREEGCIVIRVVVEACIRGRGVGMRGKRDLCSIS